MAVTIYAGVGDLVLAILLNAERRRSSQETVVVYEVFIRLVVSVVNENTCDVKPSQGKS